MVLALALALPLLGAWVASTLVVHHESSREMAVAVGLGLSLVFPLAWELLSLPPRGPGGVRPPRLLKLPTRLLLRTWAVNFLFMAGALLLSPRGVFTALSTRGDWMLPASGGPAVETARRLLFQAADGVEWAFMLAANPYREQLIAMAPRPLPRERPLPSPSEPARAEPALPSQPVPPPPVADAAKEPAPVPPPADSAKQPVPPETDTQQEPPGDEGPDVVLSWKSEPKPPEPEPAPELAVNKPREPLRVNTGWRPAVPPPEEPPAPSRGGGRFSYPLPAQLHPRVASLPSSVETDYASVAKHLVSQERDPFQRVKALHDYVADRVVYDVEALRTKKFPSQSPENVFQSRKGVCAGYSNLLAAMGQAAGEEIVTIVGDSLPSQTDKELQPHAWNAVRIEGEWYLVDVTWDAGHVGGDMFTRSYRTTYLLMPPKEFLARHIPNDPAWQLLDEPMSRGEALRYALGPSHGSSTPTPPSQNEPDAATAHVWDKIRIREPNRPRTEVKGRFNVELDNPTGLPAEVTLHNTQDGSQEPCHPQYKGTRYVCTALTRGLYRIHVLSGPVETNPQLMAQLEVLAL